MCHAAIYLGRWIIAGLRSFIFFHIVVLLFFEVVSPETPLRAWGGHSPSTPGHSGLGFAKGARRWACIRAEGSVLAPPRDPSPGPHRPARLGRAPLPYRAPGPVRRLGGRPWGEPEVSHNFPLSAKPAHHRYEYEPCHGVCALLQADRRLPGTPRCAGSILTSCSCCESSSWSPSRRTAGLSPERRLLCARANRECATKRGARTAAIEPAGVLAVSSTNQKLSS